MTQEYKKTNVNLLEGGVCLEFKTRYLKDGTLQLFKIKPLPKDFKAVEMEEVKTYDDREKRYFLKTKALKEEYEAVVNVMRTSENNYTVCGFTDEKCLLKNCKNMTEVSGFIKANFCRQLTDAL